MKKFYLNIESEIEKLVFIYKKQIIIIVNTKNEKCPGKNKSHL
ncbi:MAG: hypothetical protein Q4E39_06150 [bacterium]|nr:hypothetical protein [bacterium]